MSWYTLEEAVTMGPSVETWLQRVRAEEVSSYVDGHTRRWLWIVRETQQTQSAWGRESELVPLWKDVASLRREVVNLHGRATEPQLPLALRFVEAEPEPEPEPTPELHPAAVEAVVFEPEVTIKRHPTPSRQSSEILAQVAASWTGSDRELERQANLPKAFLAKAKRGLRNGPRSAGTWGRLEAFMQERAAVKKAA
jgi:hypothetical protein